MKRIEAFIRPHRLSRVVSALHELPRFPGFTVFDGHGQGHGRGAGGHFAYGEETGLLYHRRCMLVMCCEDEEAETIATIIAKQAHTGRPGDGLVVVSGIDSMRRVRESGDAP